MVSKLSQYWNLSFVYLVLKALTTFAANSEQCRAPLGMEDETLQDSQISAKTWLYFDRRDNRYYRPHFARLNYEKPSGGWCSADLTGQYVEVDLMENVKVTAIATQGRHNGQEWVEEFRIEYQRNKDSKYRKYTENGKWKIFNGNKDTNSTVTHAFTRPLILRRIRIIPMGNQFSIYCMRMELYGCKWKQDGLVSYSAPYGGSRKKIALQDNTYDGTIPKQASDMLTGGIGKLSDGIIATKRPSNDAKNTAWIGYKGNPIMFFTFNTSKEFQSISFHVLNKERLFERVNIEISGDGVRYKHIGSYYPTKEARANKGVLEIKVPLNGKAGKYLRCSFELRGSWLLLSEIEFDTEALSSGLQDKYKPILRAQRTESPHRNKQREIDNSIKLKKHGSGSNVLASDNKSNTGQMGLSFPIILTIVLVGSVLLIAIVVFIVRSIRTSRKSRHNTNNMESQSRISRSTDGLKEERMSLREAPPAYEEVHT